VPVALITAAGGVYHPTSAALIIGRQGRCSIYPNRPISAAAESAAQLRAALGQW